MSKTIMEEFAEIKEIADTLPDDEPRFTDMSDYDETHDDEKLPEKDEDGIDMAREDGVRGDY